MSMALGLGLGLPFGGRTGTSTPAVAFSPARGFYLGQDAGYGVDGVTIKAGGVNTTSYTVSFCIFGVADVGNNATTTPGATNNLYGGSLMVADPTSKAEVSQANGTTTFAKGIYCTFDAAPSRCAFNFNNSAGAVNATDAIDFGGDSAPPHMKPTLGQWNHYLMTWDTATAKWAIYKNGVDMRTPGYASAVAFAANSQFDLYNANGFKLNNFFQALGASGLSAGWYADFYINHGYVGNASNTIDAATLAKYVDTATGRAVDLLTDGSGPTGAQPPLWIRDRGDGVPTQAGSATATFAYFAGGNVPAVANNNKGFPAPYGPGEVIPTSRPVEIIIPQYNQMGGGAGVTAINAGTGGQPILATDFVVIHFTGFDGSNLGTHNPTSAGLTRFPVAMTYDGAGDQSESCIFYGYVGTDYASGHDFTVAVASGYTSRALAVCHVFRNVVSVDQTVFASALGGSTSTAIKVAAGNTTKKQLLLTFAGLWKAAYGMTPPALGTGTLSTVLYRSRSSAAVSANQCMCAAEEEVPAGQSYVRQITMSTADNWQCISLGLCST